MFGSCYKNIILMFSTNVSCSLNIVVFYVFLCFSQKKKTWNQTHSLYFHCSPCFLEHKIENNFKKHEPNRLLVSSFFLF